jgi:hypothetical protein
MRLILTVTLLLSACVQPDVRVDKTGTPTGTASSSVAGSPTPSPTASPLAFANAALGTAWPGIVLYEAEGGQIRERTAAGSKDIARPCGQVQRLAAHPLGLLAECRGGPDVGEDLRLVSLGTGRASLLVSGTFLRNSWPAALSPDGRSVAAFRLGNCDGPAPVCQTRVVLVDVGTGTEREILPGGHHLGARISWTPLGLTLFQPECAEAGCAGTGDKGGTFVWDGAAFKRWSDLRFVASAGSWTLLERLTSFGDYSTPRSVIVRGPQGDVALNAQARDSRALAINDLGEALVWRVDPDPIAQRGSLLRFGPDGTVRWQANLVGTVLDTVGMDVVLVASPTSAIELYDLKRLLRFETSAQWPNAMALR